MQIPQFTANLRPQCLVNLTCIADVSSTLNVIKCILFDCFTWLSFFLSFSFFLFYCLSFSFFLSFLFFFSFFQSFLFTLFCVDFYFHFLFFVGYCLFCFCFCFMFFVLFLVCFFFYSTLLLHHLSISEVGSHHEKCNLHLFQNVDMIVMILLVVLKDQQKEKQCECVRARARVFMFVCACVCVCVCVCVSEVWVSMFECGFILVNVTCNPCCVIPLLWYSNNINFKRDA